MDVEQDDESFSGQREAEIQDQREGKRRTAGIDGEVSDI